jgi:hypothetical protein
MSVGQEQEEWSKVIAELVVDGLIHSGVVKKEDADRAIEIAAEEIFVRLCLEDYPPVLGHTGGSGDT